jgi:hypothetical protein
VSELLSVTNNLKLSNDTVSKLLATSGSVTMNTLINAILLERQLLINIVKAFTTPPSKLAQLMGVNKTPSFGPTLQVQC